MSELTPEEKRKKSNRNFIILVGIALAIAFFCQVATWLSSDDDEVSRPRATTRPQTVTVEYRITGNGNGASVTYENEGGNTEQKNVSVPWTQRYTNVPRGQFVYISAQSNDDTGRQIKCEIVVNGVVIEEAQSSGRYVIASCSGRAE